MPTFQPVKSTMVVIWIRVHFYYINVLFELQHQLVVPISYFTGSPIT
jgi:hypothetical protein